LAKPAHALVDPKATSEPRCSSCGSPYVGDVGEIWDAVRLGVEALEKADELELEEPTAALKYTSNMIPLLLRHIPPTSYPLLALCRLHQNLLISELSDAVGKIEEGLTGSSAPRLPKVQVDQACAAVSRSLAAVTQVFPEGHPVRAVALAELGKLLSIDVDEDARELERLQLDTGAGSPRKDTPIESSNPFPAGADRLMLARTTLLQAREALRRGFGGNGGEVARNVEETIRNIEKEWVGWKKVVQQGGVLVE
ncbi:hypothetical protein FRB99_000399, partial [Tulasnella sp. 403]